MATFTFFHNFVRDKGNGTIDLDGDTFKAVLTNVAPDEATDEVLADITQIANGDGYTTGGVTLSGVTWLETGAGTGIWRFTCADFSWTSSGAGMAAFRYVVFYSDTPTSPADPLVGMLDYGSALSVPAGSVFEVDVGANGLFEGQGTP
jgi:hypothetical protein